MSTVIDIEELRIRATSPRSGRPAAATVALGPELPAPGDLATLLTAEPVAGLRLAQPVDLTKLPAEAVVASLAVVRECAAIGARVAWTLVLAGEHLDLVPLLDHLPAPERVVVPGGAAVLDGWRSARTFGLLYFRRGPGFLSVVDRRSGDTVRAVLDDPAEVDVFRRGLDGLTWSALTGEAAAAAERLAERDLLLRVGDAAVTLPVHMRSWPLGVPLLGGTLASAGKKKEQDR